MVFNVDGVPPFVSSGKDFWPISMRIFRLDQIKPMFVAIWYGDGKPPLSEFLKEFINEFKLIMENGVIVGDKVVAVKLKCFSCDTPARSFLKCKFHAVYISSSCIFLVIYIYIYQYFIRCTCDTHVFII